MSVSQACLPAYVDIASCLPSYPRGHCWRALGVRLLMVNAGAGCFDCRIPNYVAALAAVFSLISWPQEGSFKAPWMLLGVRFLNWAAPKHLLYCVREHSPGKKCSVGYLYCSAANDKWFPDSGTLLWWVRDPLGSTGIPKCPLQSSRELGRFTPGPGPQNQWFLFSHVADTPRKSTTFMNLSVVFACLQTRIWKGRRVWRREWCHHKNVLCTDFLNSSSVTVGYQNHLLSDHLSTHRTFLASNSPL